MKFQRMPILGQPSPLARNRRAREEDATRREFDPGIIIDLIVDPAAANGVGVMTC